MTRSTEHCIQLTFHYLNGHVESYTLYQPLTIPSSGSPTTDTQESSGLNLVHHLSQPWWILTLPDQTVFVNTANLVKVEARPSFSDIQGPAVLGKAERMTAFARITQED